MSHKERIRRALAFEPVDRLPTQANYTAAMGRLVAAHFGVGLEELPSFFGNHMIRLDISYPIRYSKDGQIKYDWWGVGFDTGEEGYFARVNPMSNTKDLDNYPWPDAHEPHLLDEAILAAESSGDEYFTIPNFGFALFERAWSLRGFEQFFLDLALDPNFACALLDRITKIQLALIDRFIELGVDGAYFGDDYGAQNSLLMSPEMWRELIKPRLAQLFAPFRDRGLPIIMHSDGQIQKILPDLVEIGLTALNPVQPEVLDHQWLYSQFGGRLAFYGGISTQTVLPNATVEEVKKAVTRCASQLAPNRTGLLVAPSHRMMTDIPLGNVVALLEAFSEL
jgi:uroporphyrinogen decarboxylase